MSEQTGTIRDLLGTIHGRMDRQDRSLDRIERLARATNGRVTALETKEAVSKALGERAEDERGELREYKQDRGDHAVALVSSFGAAVFVTLLSVGAHALHWL